MARLAVDEGACPKIRAYLERRPPTGAEIAAEADVSRQYVWRVLHGRERPSERGPRRLPATRGPRRRTAQGGRLTCPQRQEPPGSGSANESITYEGSII